MRQPDIDRAVIERQQELLAEKDEQILALAVELEATRVLVGVVDDEQLQTWQGLARIYRAQRDVLHAQVHLAIELLTAKGIIT